MPGFPAVFDLPTIVHYALFYVGALFSSALVLRMFIRTNVVRVTKVVLALLPVMWLPPLIDLALTHGAGYPMAYIFVNGNALLTALLMMGGHALFGGVTPGIKTEMAIIVIAFFSYTFVKTKKLVRALAAATAGYLLFFAWLALPSIVAAIAGAGDPLPFLIAQFSASHLAVHFMRPFNNGSYIATLGTLFNLGISYYLYFIDLVLVVVWVMMYRPGFLKPLLENWRPERAISYFVTIAIGTLVAARMGGVSLFSGWIDGAAFVMLFLSFLFAWFFAVAVNDIVDIGIDRISNAARPLANGTISESEMKSAGLFFLVWSFVGAYLIGYWALFTMMAFTAAYYVYSAPPLRLKRVPVIGTFLVALAQLAALAAGFYFVSASPFVSAFPPQLIVLTLVFFTLLTGVKDIKDIDGDRAEGITTVPVILGPYAGRIVVASAVVVAFLSVPTILVSPPLFIPSLIAGALGYYFVVAEHYKEWKVFVLYFAYVAAAGIILWK